MMFFGALKFAALGARGDPNQIRARPVTATLTYTSFAPTITAQVIVGNFIQWGTGNNIEWGSGNTVNWG
jgi:hypothetical protein